VFSCTYESVPELGLRYGSSERKSADLGFLPLSRFIKSSSFYQMPTIKILLAFSLLAHFPLHKDILIFEQTGRLFWFCSSKDGESTFLRMPSIELLNLFFFSTTIQLAAMLGLILLGPSLT
jgi:hypothetical protein